MKIRGILGGTPQISGVRKKNFFDQKFSFFGHFLLKMKIFRHFRIFVGRNQKKRDLQTFCGFGATRHSNRNLFFIIQYY